MENSQGNILEQQRYNLMTNREVPMILFHLYLGQAGEAQSGLMTSRPRHPFHAAALAVVSVERFCHRPLTKAW
jgi:hypothetical protein